MVVKSEDNAVPRISVQLVALAFVVTAITSSLGCVGYRLGAASMFQPGVRTVHIPIFESDVLRRNLGERVTEAVVKEAERRGLKAVPAPTADSTLRGRILDMDKIVLGEDVNDVPRNLEARFQVEVTWTDRTGHPLMCKTFVSAANFIPEAGQSISTAQQVAIERLARQIVSQMEMPW